MRNNIVGKIFVSYNNRNSQYFVLKIDNHEILIFGNNHNDFAPKISKVGDILTKDIETGSFINIGYWKNNDTYIEIKINQLGPLVAYPNHQTSPTIYDVYISIPVEGLKGLADKSFFDKIVPKNTLLFDHLKKVKNSFSNKNYPQTKKILNRRKKATFSIDDVKTEKIEDRVKYMVKLSDNVKIFFFESNIDDFIEEINPSQFSIKENVLFIEEEDNNGNWTGYYNLIDEDLSENNFWK